MQNKDAAILYQTPFKKFHSNGYGFIIRKYFCKAN